MSVDLFGVDAPAARAIGGHQTASTGKDEWLTPPELLAALGEPFDLDPCAPADSLRPWPAARRHISAEQDGLRADWDGLVWLNPPYSRADRWLARLAAHPGGGIALLFARTETALWHKHVWPHAARVFFLAGRLHFHHVTGKRAAANAGAPSALIAFGPAAAAKLAAIRWDGVHAHVAAVSAPTTDTAQEGRDA